ncbi:MAG: dihydroorotase [Nanobdellota archaeon]
MGYKKIDPHVHFRDESQSYKETIKHGLELASKQDIEIVFDMPNTPEPILNEKDIERRLKIVPEKQKERYRLYIGVTEEEKQIYEAIKLVRENPYVIGLKMFAGKSTGNLALIKEEQQKKVYNKLAEKNYKGVIAVHCEKEAHMGEIKFNPDKPLTHALSRPEKAEIKSVNDQIKFAKEAGFEGTLHICHLSCIDSLEKIKKVRDSEISFKITCGMTPHHILWDESRLEGNHGLLYKMNPPLRNKKNVKALREALANDEIDWIETDHAPHAIGEKLHSGHPSGYPSLYLYKKLIEEFLPSIGVKEETIKKMTYYNIKKAFNLGDNNGNR